MVLLDLVRRLPGVEVVVGHVEHGVRADSAKDAQLVREFSMSHNLKFEMTELALGPDTSEEEARHKRYDFLRYLGKKYNALAILTAHHKNDLIETAIINVVRGTGWRGLSSLRSTAGIVRPLLTTPKADILKYAEEQSLPWRHDSTNDDMRYLRNRVRHELVPKMPINAQEKLYQYIVRQNELTEQIDDEAMNWLSSHSLVNSPVVSLPRYEFIMMPQNVAHELLQAVLRQKVGKSITRPLAERALLFLHVAKPHRTFPLDATWQLRALPREVIVEQRPLVVS